MKKSQIYSFRQHLKEKLFDPKFRKAWEDSALEYDLATQLIEKRLKKKMSQRDLAKKANTTQAVISRIESMNANPSVGTLRRIATVLDSRITISFT